MDRIIETADGYDVIVAGRTFGTWRSKREAAGGLAVEQRRASDFGKLSDDELQHMAQHVAYDFLPAARRDACRAELQRRRAEGKARAEDAESERLMAQSDAETQRREAARREDAGSERLMAQSDAETQRYHEWRNRD